MVELGQLGGLKTQQDIREIKLQNKELKLQNETLEIMISNIADIILS